MADETRGKPLPSLDAAGVPNGSSPEPEPAAGAGGASAAPVGGPLEESPASSRVRRGGPYWFLFLVTALNLALDLGTKAWAKAYFDEFEPGRPRHLVVIEDFMSLIYAKNRGGAWGLFQNEAEVLRRPFFLIVSVVAIVFIVSLYRKLAPGQTALKWGLPLVLGGALGNLIDRIRFGYVVDFIDVYANWDGRVQHWPTFNVADIAICVGVLFMAIDMFTSRKPKRKAQESTGEAVAVPASRAGPASSGGIDGRQRGDGPPASPARGLSGPGEGAPADLPPPEGA